VICKRGREEKCGRCRSGKKGWRWKWTGKAEDMGKRIGREAGRMIVGIAV